MDKRTLLSSSNGRIFTVVFTKKDGTIRKMNCRLDVKKHLKGGESTTAHIDHLMTVFDMQAKGYRCINLDTIKSISLGGQTYEFH